MVISEEEKMVALLNQAYSDEMSPWNKHFKSQEWPLIVSGGISILLLGEELFLLASAKKPIHWMWLPFTYRNTATIQHSNEFKGASQRYL